MNIQDNNILVYDSLTDVYFSNPHTILDTAEASHIILRFGTWRRMIEAHPDVAETLGDQKTYYISTLTALADAVESARQAGLFPRIILPVSQYRSIMTLWKQAHDAMPEVKNMLEDAGLLAGW